MSSYKNLISRVYKILFGSIGAKLIQFMMLPYFTVILTTNEYGQLEIMLTIISLLGPLLNNGISLAVFRFSRDGDLEKRKEVFSSGAFFIVYLSILFLLFKILITSLDIKLNNGISFIILILLISFLLELSKEFLRSLEKISMYSFSGFLESFIFFILSFILIKEYKVKGILFAKFLSMTIALLFVFFKAKLYLYLKIPKDHLKTLKEMFKYSLPLIPNSMMWWIMNSSDRFLIKYHQGYELLGIYSIANKIPLLISLVSGVIILSWQSTAIDEFRKKEYNELYNNVFNGIKILLFVIGISITLGIEWVTKVFLGVDYYSSWIYVPLLALGTIFSSFSAVVGINYIVAKKNKFSLLTNLLGAITNILLNIYFIKKYSILGATLTTIFSYLIVFLCRVKNSEKISKLKINYAKFSLEILCYIAFYLVVLNKKGFVVNFGFYIITILFYFYINKIFILKIFRVIERKIKIKTKFL